MSAELMDIIVKIIVSIASTIGLAALTLLFKSVRGFIFYERVEYDLPCERAPNENPFSRTWSINWEDNRLDLEIGNISNDNIKDIIFTYQHNKICSRDYMYPSNNYLDIFEGALGVKINSIVRQKSPANDAASLYMLRFVVRRKRKLLA